MLKKEQKRAYKTDFLFANNGEEIVMDKILTDIAKQILDIETLEQRNSDDLDFHEVSVWSLKRALQLAYEAGMNSK